MHNYPDVIPMIAYEDGPKAMDWLSSVFGFKERARMLDKNGRLSHGEMQAGDGVIMLATPTPDYQAPRHHREGCEPAQKWSAVPYIVDGVLVYVDDVEAHYAKAKQLGATIITDVEADQAQSRSDVRLGDPSPTMFLRRLGYFLRGIPCVVLTPCSNRGC